MLPFATKTDDGQGRRDRWPSWSSQPALGSPAPNSPTSRPISRGSRQPPLQAQQISTFQDPLLHGVPVLPSRDTFAPSRPVPRPRHERSHSHPFPSMFSSARKLVREVKENNRDEKKGDEWYSSMLPLGLATRAHMASTDDVQSVNAKKDLMTGNCSTCGSTVRWPRPLEVFRCTICLMINDLKPIAGASEAIREAEPSKTSQISGHPALSTKGTGTP